ncbi:MAG: hypothetical protein N4A72_00595 [Bacteroidales bacterium]|jgi:hypothetical protein|nr:hypothetical protein [Bacteroidales bacterium]
MNKAMITKGSDNWVIITLEGTLYERMTDVTYYLEKGDGKTAKISEGSDSSGNKKVFVFIKDFDIK